MRRTGAALLGGALAYALLPAVAHADTLEAANARLEPTASSSQGWLTGRGRKTSLPARPTRYRWQPRHRRRDRRLTHPGGRRPTG